MALKSLIVAVLATVTIAGCAKIKESPAGTLIASLLAAKETPVPAKSIPRAEIEKAGQPVLWANMAETKRDTLMLIRDRKANGILSWGTPDGVLLTFRDGVLIETRGLGPDLLSSAMPLRTTLLQGNGHSRTYFVLGPDDVAQRIDFTCSIKGRQADNIAVFGRGHATTHVTEYCTSGIGSITNEYWMDGAVIRKAREWVSPAMGYLEFERIID
ncbi:YjbF family lipoprotein [Neotabrizicola sp. VNH66]|uniref:YjbF family lipoprotein n=1 Tax=Neotabrizicola sp. VNH66 TaxID=3400918 RepID=UPI003C043BFF